MKSSKSAFEFATDSQSSLKSQHSSSPIRDRRRQTSSSSRNNRTSRSESARSLSSSSSARELAVTSSMTSPAGPAISSKAAAVTSRLYPSTDGGFDYLKKGFYDVRFNENLKTRPPCDCHQGKSKCDESNVKHPFLKKSSSTPRFATASCSPTCASNNPDDDDNKSHSNKTSSMRKSATHSKLDGKRRQDDSSRTFFKPTCFPKDLDDGAWKPCERWRSHSGDAERRMQQLDDISRRSAESRRTKRQMSSNASDSESSSPDGGRGSSLAGYLLNDFDSRQPQPQDLQEAVRIIGGGGGGGDEDVFGGCGNSGVGAPQRPRLHHIADQRGLSTSSSFQLVSSSSTSSSSAAQYRRQQLQQKQQQQKQKQQQQQQQQQQPRRRRPFVRSFTSSKDDSRASSSMSGRSSSLSGFRSRSSSQLSYHDDSETVAGEEGSQPGEESLVRDVGGLDGYRVSATWEKSGRSSRQFSSSSSSKAQEEEISSSKSSRTSPVKPPRKSTYGNSKILKNRFSKTRKHPLKKLLHRPQISIKKRTLFLSYAVTHGSGVQVGGREIAGRTGFAQINSLGKLVSSWCRMSDSGELSSSDGQVESESLSHVVNPINDDLLGSRSESQAGEDGTTLVPNGNNGGGHRQMDGSSDEASPLRSEAEATVREGDDHHGDLDRTRNSSSGNSCERDSLCDDDNDDHDHPRVNVTKSVDAVDQTSARVRRSSGSSIEVGQHHQNYGYNDGFLLQSFLSRSFSLENYRHKNRFNMTSSDESDVALSNDAIETRAQYEALDGVFNRDPRRNRDGTTSSSIDASSHTRSSSSRRTGDKKVDEEGDGGEDDSISSRFSQLPLTPASSFLQRRSDSLLSDHERHLAEYTIAYEHDQSAPLDLRQYGERLGHSILGQSLSEIGGGERRRKPRSINEIAEELTQGALSAALMEVSNLMSCNRGDDGGEVENAKTTEEEEEEEEEVQRETLDQISMRMSHQIIKDSEVCILQIIDFADQVSKEVVSASLEHLTTDSRTRRGREGSVERAIDNQIHDAALHLKGVVESWTMSSNESLVEEEDDGDDVENSVEGSIVDERGEEEEELVREEEEEEELVEEELIDITDLPSTRDEKNVVMADACVGGGDFLDDGNATSNSSAFVAKIVADACTQTSVTDNSDEVVLITDDRGIVDSSPALDERYLENQWYPVSDNDDAENQQVQQQQQDAVIGLWQAFSKELESNSQFLKSDELMEYFSGGSAGGGIGDIVNESSSISLREHLQSQLTSTDSLSIPQALESNSIADVLSADDGSIPASGQYNGSLRRTEASDESTYTDEDNVHGMSSRNDLGQTNVKEHLQSVGCGEDPTSQWVTSSPAVSNNHDALSLSSYADLPPRLSTTILPSRSMANHFPRENLNSTMDASFSTTTEEDERDRKRDDRGEEASRLFFVDSDEDLEHRVARILNDTHDDMIKWKRDAKKRFAGSVMSSTAASALTSALSGSCGSSRRLAGSHQPTRTDQRKTKDTNAPAYGDGDVTSHRKGSSTRHRTLTDSSVEPVSSSFASTSLESLQPTDNAVTIEPTSSRSPNQKKKKKNKTSFGGSTRPIGGGVSTEEEMLRQMISSTDRILQETLDSDSDVGSLLSKETTRKEDSGIFSTKCFSSGGGSRKSKKWTSADVETRPLAPSPRHRSVPHLSHADRNGQLQGPIASTPYDGDVLIATASGFPLPSVSSSSKYKLDLSGLDPDPLPSPRGSLSARPKLETAFDEDELIVKAKSSLQSGRMSTSVAPPPSFSSSSSSSSAAISKTLPRVKSHYDRWNNTPHFYSVQYSVPENVATLTKSFVALPSASSSGHATSHKSKHLSPKEHRIILANIRKSLVEASKDLDRIS